MERHIVISLKNNWRDALLLFGGQMVGDVVEEPLFNLEALAILIIFIFSLAILRIAVMMQPMLFILLFLLFFILLVFLILFLFSLF